MFYLTLLGEKFWYAVVAFRGLKGPAHTPCAPLEVPAKMPAVCMQLCLLLGWQVVRTSDSWEIAAALDVICGLAIHVAGLV
jgi:hypothetical protein